MNKSTKLTRSMIAAALLSAVSISPSVQAAEKDTCMDREFNKYRLGCPSANISPEEEPLGGLYGS